MPEVTLNPKNQCTLDDPTDGADLPSAVSSARTTNELPTAAPAPPCLAQEPGSGGTTSECTDELVRQFAGPGGAGPFAPTPLEREQSCAAEGINFGSNCGKVAYEALKKQVNPVDLATCAASLVAFGLCELKGD